MHVVFLLTKPPYGSEEPERVLEMALALSREHQLTLFLTGDGVLSAIAGQAGPIGERIGQLIAAGGRVVVSEDDLAARGLPAARRLDGIEAQSTIYDQFVETVMENADRVVSC